MSVVVSTGLIIKHQKFAVETRYASVMATIPNAAVGKAMTPENIGAVVTR